MDKQTQLKIKKIEEQIEQLKPYATKYYELIDKLYELNVVEFYNYILKFERSAMENMIKRGKHE